MIWIEAPVHDWRLESGSMGNEDLAAVHVGVIARDPDALVAFESAVRPLVRGMLRHMRLGNEDADEVWNDAFLVAIEQAPSVTPLGVGLRRLAVTVAQRRGIDVIRKRSRHPQTTIEAAEGIYVGLGIPLDEATAGAVRGCVERAKPLHAQVIEMASRGLTAREISVVLDTSEANAAKLRQRARAWFAECLKGVITNG
jgi:DNA-directed RNA polymerase specialized sigma24 family protein